MKNRRKHVATIFARICIPLAMIVLAQAAIFYLVTVHGHVVSTLNGNAADILTERVYNRKNELQSMFTSQWGNIDNYDDIINQLYKEYDGSHEEPLYTDNEQQKQFLLDASDTLVDMLRDNSVNGAFIILNNTKSVPVISSQEHSYYGLCIRDYDQASDYTDREDILTERCPSSLTSQLGCSLDTYWEAQYTYSTATGDNGDYFYEPIQQAHDNPGISADNLAYFSGAHTLTEGSPSVVSYSMPLIADNGDVYGVIGVELTTDYLASILPSNELQGKDSAAYMLVQYEEGSMDYHVIAYDGSLYKRCFGDEDIFTLNSENVIEDSELYTYEGRQKLNVCCSVSPISIYNRNTPFDNEVVALVGVVQNKVLFSVSTQIRHSLVTTTLLVLILGFATTLLISHLLTRPIKKLAARVQAMGPDDDAQLEHINIREIDQLADAIETKTQKINQTKVRTEFFSRMSHDMRTPMNAIIGFSSSEVTDGCTQNQLMEYLGKIHGSGRYLLGLINEVLDMTKIDSGRMELEERPFCVQAFWNDMIPMIDELAAQKQIQFVREIQSEEGRYIVGDEQRMSQIFVNLLSNAIKFTPENGSVYLIVEEQKLLTEQIVYRVTVRDTGVGMSEEFQNKMYQPFMQEHINRDGTGLGLSIAQQLISLMGGTIRCDSTPGQGTTFTVELTLPVADKPVDETEEQPVEAVHDTAQSMEQDKSEDAIARILDGKRILLCEDHPLNRQIACRLLENKNMVVDIAENGQEGYEKIMNSPLNYYDAILMDIRMPILDGLGATRAIRALDRTDASTMPIIAMTANAFQEDMDASKAAGMNAHLSKPIEPKKLYATLAQFLENRIDNTIPIC